MWDRAPKGTAAPAERIACDIDSYELRLITADAARALVVGERGRWPSPPEDPAVAAPLVLTSDEPRQAGSAILWPDHNFLHLDAETHVTIGALSVALDLAIDGACDTLDRSTIMTET